MGLDCSSAPTSGYRWLEELPALPESAGAYRWFYADVTAGEYSAVFIFMVGSAGLAGAVTALLSIRTLLSWRLTELSTPLPPSSTPCWTGCWERPYSWRPSAPPSCTRPG
jgi:hypothetical protein